MKHFISINFEGISSRMSSKILPSLQFPTNYSRDLKKKGISNYKKQGRRKCTINFSFRHNENINIPVIPLDKTSSLFRMEMIFNFARIIILRIH